jgi:hypothetical protein
MLPMQTNSSRTTRERMAHRAGFHAAWTGTLPR